MIKPILSANLLGTGTILALLIVPCSGLATDTTFIRPGDDGTIELVIENDPASDFSVIEDVEVTVIAPAHFLVENTSKLGPFTIEPGKFEIVVVNYRIADNAPDGAFDVVLDVDQKTTEVEWSPQDPDAIVAIPIENIPFSERNSADHVFKTGLNNGAIFNG